MNEFIFIPTKNQKSDIFTKRLSKKRFCILKRKICICASLIFIKIPYIMLCICQLAWHQNYDKIDLRDMWLACIICAIYFLEKLLMWWVYMF